MVFPAAKPSRRIKIPVTNLGKDLPGDGQQNNREVS
jgi:hypothetical protein